MDQYAWSPQGGAGAAYCYKPDNQAPTLASSLTNANGATYLNNTWTQQNVTLTVSGIDNWEGGYAPSGLNPLKWYTVNGALTYTYANPITLSFTKE